MNLSDGDKIGPYVIRDTAGQGGMATVYKAWHEGLHRFEALKVPRGAGGSAPDSAFILRLLTEARVAAGLHHPNIVAIHGVSEPFAPIPFFAMDWVEGRDLAKILSEKRAFSIAETVQVLEPVAAALDYAHSKGVVHRDIKPANILVTEADGTLIPHVVDFGISRAAEDEDGATKLTKSGMMVGTPEYMSPEQSGSGEAVDYRTDIYSLAVVAYEMLCGCPPFTAGSGVSRLSILISHVRDIAPLYKKFPDFPKAAGDVLLRALAKSPQDRPTSCVAFLAQLKAAAGQNERIFATEADFERTPFDSSRFDPADDATMYERPLPVMNTPRTLPEQPAGAATAVTTPESGYSLRARLEAAGPPGPIGPPVKTPPASPKAKLLETASIAAPAATIPERLTESKPRPNSRVALLAGLGGVVFGALLVFFFIGREPAVNPMVVSEPTPTAITATSAPTASAPVEKAPAIPVLKTLRLTRTRDIDFDTVERRSDSRPLGSRDIIQAGKKGSRLLTFAITYQGSKEMARRVVSDRIVSMPTTQIVVVGTRRATPVVRKRVEPEPVKVRPRKARVERPAAPRRPERKAAPPKSVQKRPKAIKKRHTVHEAPLPP